MKENLEKIIGGQNLSFEESMNSMGHIMDGTANQAEIAAWLIALKIKGETAEEVAGSAQAMRERSIKITSRRDRIIDVCGTGGDNSGTFNISTTVAFVIAAAGIPVAKHGNRSVSSKCGSADLMKALGININLPPRRAQAALDESVRYSKERVQFGKPISTFQAIQWMIADMATAVEASRFLTYHAAWCYDQGLPYSKEAAMAKLFASETAVYQTNRAVQIHGGIGYIKGHKVERLYRDAKITEIYEGTSEVMRMVISGNVLR